MRRIAFFTLTSVILAAFPAQAQSLNETFDWIPTLSSQQRGTTIMCTVLSLTVQKNPETA